MREKDKERLICSKIDCKIVGNVLILSHQSKASLVNIYIHLSRAFIVHN